MRKKNINQIVIEFFSSPSSSWLSLSWVLFIFCIELMVNWFVWWNKLIFYEYFISICMESFNVILLELKLFSWWVFNIFNGTGFVNSFWMFYWAFKEILCWIVVDGLLEMLNILFRYWYSVRDLEMCSSSPRALKHLLHHQFNSNIHKAIVFTAKWPKTCTNLLH